MARPIPVPDEVAEWLALSDVEDCETQSGLVWRKDRSRFKAGQPAGYLWLDKNSGKHVWVIRFNYKTLLARRVVYKLAYGIDPGERKVFHKDNDWMNNKASNLYLEGS